MTWHHRGFLQRRATMREDLMIKLKKLDERATKTQFLLIELRFLCDKIIGREALL